MKTLWLFLCMALLASPLACGGDDDDGDGDGCPDLTGTWRVTEHCEADAMGMTVVITQTGCTFTTDAGGTSVSGTMNSDGDFSISFDPGGGDVWNCDGRATATVLTEICNGDCNIRVEKQ